MKFEYKSNFNGMDLIVILLNNYFSLFDCLYIINYNGIKY